MPTRRSALHAVGTAAVFALCGCADGPDQAGDATADGPPPSDGQRSDGNSAEEPADGDPQQSESRADGDDADGGETRDGTGGSGGERDDPAVDPVPVRIDEPPYPIDPPGAGGDWNAGYLCENMPEGPSLSFEVETGWFQVVDGLGSDRRADGRQYHAALFAEESDLDRLDVTGRTAEFVRGTDFAESVLVAVEAGWGSSSVSIHVGRVEAVEDGLHVHACYHVPERLAEDSTAHAALVRVERPESVERATVSLTVAADRRVHFNSTEGVVTVGR